MAGELQYLQQVRHILQHGHRKDDRTGTGTISVFGMQARYSLRGRHRGGTRGPRAAPQRWGSGAIFSARGAAEVFGGSSAAPSPYSRLPRLRDTPGNAFCILGRSGSAPGWGGERREMGREPSCCAGRGGRTGEIGLCMLEKFPLSLLWGRIVYPIKVYPNPPLSAFYMPGLRGPACCPMVSLAALCKIPLCKPSTSICRRTLLQEKKRQALIFLGPNNSIAHPFPASYLISKLLSIRWGRCPLEKTLGQLALTNWWSSLTACICLLYFQISFHC